MLSDVGGGRLASVLDAQFFLIKDKWIYNMTRHYANNILLARNLPFDFLMSDSAKSPFNDTIALFYHWMT